MMMTKQPSGLLVPHVSVVPPKPQRAFGPLEVRGDAQRNAVRVALGQLWRAAELDRGGGIVLPGGQSYEAIELLRDEWRLLGKKLLGPDAPECEIKT